MNNTNISDIQGKDGIKNWKDMAKLVGKITWSWQGWLPNGFLIIVASSSGTGKSSLILRLCGCFTNGWDLPDETPFTGEQGTVLWCEGEAAQAINLERALIYNLDMSRIITPFNDPLQDVNLDNKDHRDRIRTLAFIPEVKLIVVDSLRGVNSQDENSSNINEMIKFLAEIARDTGKIILLTHHLRKKNINESEEVEIDRLRGSSAIVQTARVVWAIDMPNGPDNPKRLRVIKSNLGKFPPPLGFLITESGVEFCDSPTSQSTSSQISEAKDLLRIILKDGPVAANRIKMDFEENGISWRTAAKAKKELKIKSLRSGGKDGFWIWKFPDQDGQPPIEGII